MLKKQNPTILKRASMTFMFFVAILVVLSSSNTTFAQEGNMYEEPWHPASRFAVKEAAKQQKLTITLVKVNDATFTTGEAGLDFNMCLTVKTKAKGKKAVTRYVYTNVFRNDKTMAYELRSWVLKKDSVCGN